MNDIDEYERHLREVIRKLQEDYYRAVAPYMKRLGEIQAYKPPAPVFIDVAALSPATLEMLKKNDDAAPV